MTVMFGGWFPWPAVGTELLFMFIFCMITKNDVLNRRYFLYFGYLCIRFINNHKWQTEKPNLKFLSRITKFRFYKGFYMQLLNIPAWWNSLGGECQRRCKNGTWCAAGRRWVLIASWSLLLQSDHHRKQLPVIWLVQHFWSKNINKYNKLTTRVKSAYILHKFLRSNSADVIFGFHFRKSVCKATN